MVKQSCRFRTLPSDEEYLKAMQEVLGLDKTALIRLSIRYFAHQQGLKHPDLTEALVTLKLLATGCRIAGVQGLDKYLNKAERLLKKHSGRLKWDVYPEEVEREVVRDEALNRRQMAVNQQLGKSRRSLENQDSLPVTE